jgi:hypothetical protein
MRSREFIKYAQFDQQQLYTKIGNAMKYKRTDDHSDLLLALKWHLLIKQAVNGDVDDDQNNESAIFIFNNSQETAENSNVSYSSSPNFQLLPGGQNSIRGLFGEIAGPQGNSQGERISIPTESLLDPTANPKPFSSLMGEINSVFVMARPTD